MRVKKSKPGKTEKHFSTNWENKCELHIQVSDAAVDCRLKKSKESAMTYDELIEFHNKTMEINNENRVTCLHSFTAIERLSLKLRKLKCEVIQALWSMDIATDQQVTSVCKPAITPFFLPYVQSMQHTKNYDRHTVTSICSTSP